MKTLWAALQDAATSRGDAVALECGMEVLTFEEWVAQAQAMSRRLAATCEPGQFVGLAAAHGNWASFAVAYMATQLAGAVPVPLRADASPRDWDLMCRDAGVTFVLSTTPAHVQRGFPSEVAVGDLRGDWPQGDLPEINETADALFTSGTMGVPKAVASLHTELLSGGRLPPAWRGRILVHTMPPYSAGGVHGAMRLAIMSAVGAATTSALSVLELASLLALLARPSTVAFYTTPQFVKAISREVQAAEARAFDHVRMIIVTGSAIDGPSMHAAARVFRKASLVNAYGSTEAGMAQTFMVYDMTRPNAVGRSVGRTEVRILDDSGVVIAEAGRHGEIALRRSGAPQRRYLTPNEEGAFAGDGWVKTGDLGFLDPDGYLYVTDRKKDIAIRGAENVSMRQIEEAMLEHPGISDAGVVAIPSADGNDRIVAFVVGAATVSELRELVRAHVSSPSAFPRSIHFVDEIPRNSLGKTDKSALRLRAIDSARSL